MKEITLMYLLDLAWRRIFVIIGAFLIFAAAAFGYFSFLVEPRYVATSSVLLTNGGSLTNEQYDNTNSIGNADIVASINIMNTYADFLKEPEIYRLLSQKASQNFNENITWSSLRGAADISVRNENSLFIDIKFSATSPERAIYYTNTFASLTPEYFSKTFPHAAVTITSESDAATKTYPRTISSSVIIGFLSAVLAYGICLIIDSLNLSIRGEEGYTSHFDIPLLGCVPDFQNESASNQSSNGFKEEVE